MVISQANRLAILHKICYNINYMKKKTKNLLIKHLKAFAWGLGMMILAFTANFISVNVAGWGLPTEFAVILGLFFARISKELNTRYDLEQYLIPTKN